MPNNQTKHIAISCVVLLAVGILVWVLTDYIEWYGDALCYRFSFLTGQPIESVGDIVPSQYAHYYMMNGRIFAHILCQGFTALWGKATFATCNSIVYIILILLFCRVTGANLLRVKPLLTAVIILLILSDTSYVPNCQIGYIWTATLTLCFILLYYRTATHPHTHKYIVAAGCCICSLIAGNGNEAIEIGVGAALCIDLIINRRQRTHLQWAMAASFFIGLAMLCLAPGIIKRAGTTHNILFYSAYHFLIYSRIFYLLIIIVIIKTVKREMTLSALISNEYLCITAIATLIAFNFVIGINGMRQLFGIELFSAILSVKLLKDRALPVTAIIPLAILTVYLYALKFNYLKDYNRDFRSIRAELTKSQDSPIFHDFSSYSSIVHPSEVYKAQEDFHLITSGILDDINNHGNHYINLHNGEQSHLFKANVYPTAVSECIAKGSEYMIDRCEDGTYVVAKRKDSNVKFAVYEQDLFGRAKNAEPIYIDFGDYDQFNLTEYSGYEILLFNHDYPLSKITRIEAVEE